MRHMLFKNNFSTIALVFLAFFMIATISLAHTVGDPYANTSYIVDFDFVPIAGEQNSTSFNASISGSVLGDTNVNSSNQTGGIFYNITYGILAGATEVTSTSSTTTTVVQGLGGTVSFSTSDNRISGISVDPGANVTLKAFQNVPITQINFIANRSISNGAISIKKLNTSNLTVSQIKEKANTYLSVEATNIPDIALRVTKIRFYIPKSWMTENNAGASQIVLQRYDAGSWRRLPTVQISSDNTNMIFESDSPGFSIFAISALPLGETAPTSTTMIGSTATTAPSVTTTTSAEVSTTTVTTTPQKGAQKNIFEMLADLLKSLLDALRKLIETIAGKNK